MKQIYVYTFYLLFELASKREFDKTPVLSAIFGITIIILFNIFNIIIICNFIFSVNILEGLNIVIILGGLLCLLLLNLVPLTRNKRYKNIIEKCSRGNELQLRRIRIVGFTYIGVSFISLIITLFVIPYLKG